MHQQSSSSTHTNKPPHMVYHHDVDIKIAVRSPPSSPSPSPPPSSSSSPPTTSAIGTNCAPWIDLAEGVLRIDVFVKDESSSSETSSLYLWLASSGRILYLWLASERGRHYDDTCLEKGLRVVLWFLWWCSLCLCERICSGVWILRNLELKNQKSWEILHLDSYVIVSQRTDGKKCRRSLTDWNIILWIM